MQRYGFSLEIEMTAGVAPIFFRKMSSLFVALPRDEILFGKIGAAPAVILTLPQQKTIPNALKR